MEIVLYPPKVNSKNKGSYQGFQKESTGVEIVMWNDNGAVTVRSNCESILPISNARRWSKEAKDYINVPRSSMIGGYNASIGGTDLMDQSIASYRPLPRNCKWYWPCLYTVSKLAFTFHGCCTKVWKRIVHSLTT